MKTFSIESIDGIIEARSLDFINDINKSFSNDHKSYIDALVDYAEKHNIEMETLGEIIKKTPTLLSSVAEEAEEMNLLPKTARLQF